MKYGNGKVASKRHAIKRYIRSAFSRLNNIFAVPDLRHNGEGPGDWYAEVVALRG